jgi:hypothetical protein
MAYQAPQQGRTSRPDHDSSLNAFRVFGLLLIRAARSRLVKDSLITLYVERYELIHEPPELHAQGRVLFLPELDTVLKHEILLQQLIVIRVSEPAGALVFGDKAAALTGMA